MDKKYIYICKLCDYKTCDKSNFNKHNNSKKHIKRINDSLSNNKNNTINTNCEKNESINKDLKFHKCTCGIVYKNRHNLSRHKKQCNNYFISKIIYINEKDNDNKNETIDQNKLINHLYNENKQLKKSLNKIVTKNNEIVSNTVIENIMEKIDNIPKLVSENCNNTIYNNTTYNNMNINIFLNETCKNAVNMDNFLSNLNIKFNDLMYTKEHGITDGVSNIFIDNINKLSIHERPLHCTDLKREILYIKNDDKWEKDDEHKTKTKKSIKYIANLQAKNIKVWHKENPNYMDSDKKKDEFVHLIKNITDDISDKDKKVISAICKSVHLTKEKKIIAQKNTGRKKLNNEDSNEDSNYSNDDDNYSNDDDNYSIDDDYNYNK